MLLNYVLLLLLLLRTWSTSTVRNAEVTYYHSRGAVCSVFYRTSACSPVWRDCIHDTVRQLMDDASPSVQQQQQQQLNWSTDRNSSPSILSVSSSTLSDPLMFVCYRSSRQFRGVENLIYTALSTQPWTFWLQLRGTSCLFLLPSFLYLWELQRLEVTTSIQRRMRRSLVVDDYLLITRQQ